MSAAVVVREGLAGPEVLVGVLAAAGFEASAVATCAEARARVEAGAVIVLLGHGESWESQRLAPVLSMPGPLRRGTVVAVIGPGLATGDSVRAFMLSVDLVVAAAEAQRLGEVLTGAVAAKRALVSLLDLDAAGRLLA